MDPRGRDFKGVQFLHYSEWADVEILSSLWDLSEPSTVRMFASPYIVTEPITIKSRNLPKEPMLAYSAPGIFAFEVETDPYGVKSTTSQYVTAPAHNKEITPVLYLPSLAMQVVARFVQWVKGAVYLQSLFPTFAVQTAKLSSAMPTALVRMASISSHAAPEADSVMVQVMSSTAPDAQAIDIHISQDVELVEKATSYAYFLGVNDELTNGYFSTELAALQNATDVWGMDPGMVFGVKQPSGLWTWAQAVPYTNLCGSEVKGYVSGG
jgi:hypothetical protein